MSISYCGGSTLTTERRRSSSPHSAVSSKFNLLSYIFVKRSAATGPGGELAIFPDSRPGRQARQEAARLAGLPAPRRRRLGRKIWRCTCASGGPARRKDSAFDAGGGSRRRQPARSYRFLPLQQQL